MKKLLIILFSPLVNIFIFFFSLKKIQILLDLILHVVLKAKGFKNFGNFYLSGERNVLNFIKGYNLDYSLDIGANTGTYTEKLINITKTKIICFEPSKDSFRELKKVKKKYPKKIIIFNIALSDKNEILNFYKVGKKSQLASFEKNIQNFSYVDKKKVTRSKIKCQRGESFISKINFNGRIDFIKVDTEGHDFKVLKGLIKTIKKHNTKFIQFEMNWHNLFNGQNLFKISSNFKGYNIYRILPYSSGLIKVNPSHPDNNFFHLSNYLLVRKDIKIN